MAYGEWLVARRLINRIAVRQTPVHPSEEAVQDGNLAADPYVRRSLEVERQLVPLKNTPFVIGDITPSGKPIAPRS